MRIHRTGGSAAISLRTIPLLGAFALAALASSCNMDDLRNALGPDFQLTDPNGVPIRGPEAEARGRAVGTSEDALFITIAGEFTSSRPFSLLLDEATTYTADGRQLAKVEFISLLRSGDAIVALGNIQSADSMTAKSIELKRNSATFREGLDIRDPRGRTGDDDDHDRRR